MNHCKVIYVVFIAILVKADRYRGGGWGSRPSGNVHGQPNRHQQNNWGPPQRVNNNGWGHQPQGNNNRNVIHFNNNQGSHNQAQISCTRPVFTDDAKLVVEKCEQERYQMACWNSSSNIPMGWKVYMDCRKGPLIMQYPSTCSNSGEWSPELVENCDLLFERAKAKPLANEGQCAMLKMEVSENFIFACFLPEANLEAEECQKYKAVPSGTNAMLKCKPPFQSQDGRNSEWTCNKGSWTGDFTYKLKCYYSSQIDANPNSNHDMATTTHRPIIRTTTTIAPIIIIPVTYRTTTTSRPRTTIKTTSIPMTQRTTKAPTTTRRPTQSTAIQPTKKFTCPPLKTRSPGIKLECISKSSGGAVSSDQCNVPQPVGSEASYSCKQYYESTAGFATLYRKCKEDFTFSNIAVSETFNCVLQCGRNNQIFVPFITSGQPTTRGQWPWHAAMFLKEHSNEKTKWTYICGGTLISRRAIITASHCVTFVQSAKVRDKSNFRIDLGRFELEQNIDEIIQAKEVQSIHPHPSYSPYGYDSDLAIIILKDDVTIGYHVRPICFPQTVDSALEQLQVSESSVGTVAGWGYNERSELANELQMAELKVGSQNDCSESARGIETGGIQAKSTTFCARNKNGSKDVNVCNGDSGGGMYFPLKNSDFTRWYLQGIVSVGVADERGKCKPSQYSIFTRVGRYADWIIRVLSENDAL